MRTPRFTTELDDATATLAVTGDVDVDAATRIALELDRLVARGGGTIDLSGLTYLPSSLVGVVVVMMDDARLAGSVLRVVAAAGTIAGRSLSVMGVPHDPE